MAGHLWLRRKEKALNAALYKPFPATPSWGPQRHLGGHYALRGWKGLSFEITSPLCSPLSVVSDGVYPSTSRSMNKGTCTMLSEPSSSPLASAPSKLIFQTFPKHQRHSLLCNNSLVQIWIHLGSGSDSLDRPAWRPVVRTDPGDWVSGLLGIGTAWGRAECLQWKPAQPPVSPCNPALAALFFLH